MPVSVNTNLVPLSQATFAEIAYGVMKTAFDLHVSNGGVSVSRQTSSLCGDEIGVRVTKLADNAHHFEKNLIRFGRATGLCAIQWINIANHIVSFHTLCIPSR